MLSAGNNAARDPEDAERDFQYFFSRTDSSFSSGLTIEILGRLTIAPRCAWNNERDQERRASTILEEMKVSCSLPSGVSFLLLLFERLAPF
jgi:hypothetical protein